MDYGAFHRTQLFLSELSVKQSSVIATTESFQPLNI